MSFISLGTSVYNKQIFPLQMYTLRMKKQQDNKENSKTIHKAQKLAWEKEDKDIPNSLLRTEIV